VTPWPQKRGSRLPPPPHPPAAMGAGAKKIPMYIILAAYAFAIFLPFALVAVRCYYQSRGAAVHGIRPAAALPPTAALAPTAAAAQELAAAGGGTDTTDSARSTVIDRGAGGGEGSTSQQRPEPGRVLPGRIPRVLP
jgi:hypothetical protein